MGKVGIVVPAYNPGDHLRRALSSVLRQTFQAWQLVVVDDGSTEDLTWVSHLDPRVELLRQVNRGVSRARNSGVLKLQTKYVAFLDQDDEWRGDKLEQQMAGIDETTTFSHTNFYWDFGNEQHEGTYQDEVDYSFLLRFAHIAISSVVVQRRRILEVGGFDPLLAMMQDYDLFLRLLMDGGKTVCVREPLVTYHLHSRNASRDYRRTAAEGMSVLGAHLRRARGVGNRLDVESAAAGLRHVRALYAQQALTQARASEDFAERASHLASAVSLKPSVVIRDLTQSRISALGRHRS